MARLHDNILGYYISSLYGIQINSGQTDMTFSNPNKRERTILFHEYIHFLQDFTTHYGLTNLCVDACCIKNIVSEVKQSKSLDVFVPITVTDKTLIDLTDILRITRGDTSDFDINRIEDIEVEAYEIEDNQYINKIPQVNIKFDGEYGTFGAEAIMESMAYIMERCCSIDGFKESSSFQYKAAELVADHIVPHFSDNIKMVLALCDVSLQFINPGYFFVDVMNRIKNKTFLCNEPKDMYSLLNKPFGDVSQNVAPMGQNFCLILEDARHRLKAYLNCLNQKTNGLTD